MPKRKGESELCLLMVNLTSLSTQQSVWLAGIDANPLQIEFAEPWEEFCGEIGLHHCVGREPRQLACGSLERHYRKLHWLHRRLSEPQERLSHLLCQKAYRFLYEKSPKSLESESMLETLGLMEPDERSYSNFSWSNSTTSDSTVYPRSMRSACAMVFSLVEKTVSPAESPSSVRVRKIAIAKFF